MCYFQTFKLLSSASKVLTQKVSEAGSSMTHEAKMKASATTVALVSGAQQSRYSSM